MRFAQVQRMKSEVETAPVRSQPQSMPENIRSVQPGSGKCYRIELAWGQLRRWILKRFRPRYVRRMAQLRLGDASGAPHEILDPRDLKFCCNLCDCHWLEADDPFRWREKIPFARWGLAELQLMGWPLLAASIALALLGTPYVFGAPVVGILFILVVYFFRDPQRTIPGEPGLVVSPADGKVVEITSIENDEFIGGPAVRISIFLSLLNVHINRAPSESRVIRMRYTPGLFFNAMNPLSALKNENLWIALEEEVSPHRRLVVRQISGMIARRIVCQLKPGDVIERGEKFGMIKLGSRTELIFPDNDDLKVEVKLGQSVSAGSTIMARYAS